MYHPLVQRLIDELGCVEITLDNHDVFVDQEGIRVLFFVGDPKRNRESTDVAVVLPELIKVFPALRAGIVADYPGAGASLEPRYGFKKWPALVFLRNGDYLGVITGIRNWADYLELIPELLAGESRRPPGFKIPVVVEVH